MTWIDSQSEELRAAVVHALCVFRPVAGCERILPRAWKRATWLSLGTCASAVESTCTAWQLVPADLITSVFDTLLSAPPVRTPEAADADPGHVLPYKECMRQAQRAVLHFAKLLFIVAEDEAAEFAEPDAETVDYGMAVRVLLEYLRRTIAARLG